MQRAGVVSREVHKDHVHNITYVSGAPLDVGKILSAYTISSIGHAVTIDPTLTTQLRILGMTLVMPGQYGSRESTCYEVFGSKFGLSACIDRFQTLRG